MWVYKLDSSADIYDTMIVDLSTVEQGVTDPSGGLNEGCEMVYWTRLTHSDTTLHTPPKGAPAFFKSHDDYRSYYGKTSGSWTVHHNDSDNKAKYLNSGDLFWYPFKDGEIARGNSTYIKFDGLISYDS
ncbi:MAG: hypothetical protein ACXWEY_00350, partial [Bacteroidia bacterium]